MVERSNLIGSRHVSVFVTMCRMKERPILLDLFNAGIEAVSGQGSVQRALRELPDFRPDRIIAIGKAAGTMVKGAQLVYGINTPTLLATKYQHCDSELALNPMVEVIESGHPVPDENSLRAGKKILDCVESMRREHSLLLLVSGGASAIAEKLQPGMSLDDWQAMNEEMLAAGLNIEQINQRRKQVSQIKDGRLLSHFHGQQVVVCAISDVQGDQLSTIGSGIGEVSRCPVPHRVLLVASNQVARDAVADLAHANDLQVRLNEENLYDDVFVLAGKIGQQLLRAEPGLYIWGGEPTIVLPDNPGEGGRNQALALALALEIKDCTDIQLLVAGTDGTDGPTDAAGGIVDGSTIDDPIAAQDALLRADAGTYLDQAGARLVTGPTGTNVMDLVIALVE